MVTLSICLKKDQVEEGYIVYTSGADGIISSGIPIGKITIVNNKKYVKFFADFDQINFVKVYFKKWVYLLTEFILKQLQVYPL